MTSRRHALALTLALAGCSGDATAPSAPPPALPSPGAAAEAPPATAATETPPAPGPLPVTGAPTATSTASAPTTATSSTRGASRRSARPRLSAADRARVDEALREGRRLTRAGEHAAALARFETALSVDRGAWRVSCEAGFVAWRAGNLEAADRLVRGAMTGMPPGFVPEADRVPTAMCLFNAGLVEEATGHPDRAREMWEASLRLRDHATVRTRLAALPPAEDRRRPWETLPVTASIEQIAGAMRADFAANGLAGLEPGEVAAHEIPLEIERLDGGTGALTAHRIHASFAVSLGMQYVEALVVRGADTQAVALLGQAFDAGLSESSTSLDVLVRFEDVLPGGAPELVAEVRETGGSVDCMGSGSHLLVCSGDDSTLRCFSAQLSAISECVSMEAEDEDGEVEGSCRVPRFAAGDVVFEPCEGDRSYAREAPFIDGAHALRALLERGDLRWPDAWSPLEPIGS